MAKHLGSSPKKKSNKSLPSAKELPRLIEWKAPARRRFCYTRLFSKEEIAPVLAAVVLFLATWAAPLNPLFKLIAYAVTALVAAFTTLRRAFLAGLNRRWPDEDCFALIASLCAFLARHPAAGALLVILSKAAELTEAYILARSARGVESIREYLPEKAHVEEEFGLVDVLPEELKEGDIYVVMQGERVPVDGIVLEGLSRVDSSAFGGGDTPASVQSGDEVLSGVINTDDILRLRAIRSFEDSALAKHIKCLENANNEKTVSEDRLELYASIVSPVILCIALVCGVLIPLLGGSWQRGLSTAAIVLLLGSPSVLILSVPVIFLGGLSCASHSGFRFRSKRVLEKLFRARTVVFGKTGTITDGRYAVTEVISAKFDEDDLLRVAAAAESRSRHPIASAIKQAAGWTEEKNAEILKVEEVPGRGISAFIEGKHVYVGNASLLEEHGIGFQVPHRAGSAIHVAVDGVYWGYILVSDKIREGAFDAIEELRSQGLRNIVMLTGDVRSATSRLARSLNFDMIKTDQTPEDKLSAVSYLRKSLGNGESLVYVGDGFHDADMFERADVGIALNAMGDLRAEEAADVVLMDEDILRVPQVMMISSGISRLLLENVVLVAGIKLILLILALTGLLSILPAAVLNTVCTVLACVNSLRSFKVE